MTEPAKQSTFRAWAFALSLLAIFCNFVLPTTAAFAKLSLGKGVPGFSICLAHGGETQNGTGERYPNSSPDLAFHCSLCPLPAGYAVKLTDSWILAPQAFRTNEIIHTTREPVLRSQHRGLKFDPRAPPA